jgi:ketosteroid isomerase-like protein
MTLDEDEVRAAVHSLSSAGWVRLASGAGSRAAKYRQLFDESLDLLPSESALLGMLFLRGPQTVNELRTRTARAHAFADNDQVTETLTRLSEAELVHELPRETGQREARWTHLIAGDEPAEPTLEDVIDAYNEAWNRHDLDGIVAHHAPGMVFQNYNAGERAEGNAVRDHIGDIFENWPDLRFTGRTLYVGDDFVVQEWTAHATHPSGKELTWEGVDLFPFRNGKILRKDVYSNASRRVPEQLGPS